jgi:hypothetical protein
MEKQVFIEIINRLLSKDRIEDCIICMKHLHINISIDDAKMILKSAHKYMNVVGDLPFPKEIGGVLYESVGEFVLKKLTDSQIESITKSGYTNFRIE